MCIYICILYIYVYIYVCMYIYIYVCLKIRGCKMALALILENCGWLVMVLIYASGWVSGVERILASLSVVVGRSCPRKIDISTAEAVHADDNCFDQTVEMWFWLGLKSQDIPSTCGLHPLIAILHLQDFVQEKSVELFHGSFHSSYIEAFQYGQSACRCFSCLRSSEREIICGFDDCPHASIYVSLGCILIRIYTYNYICIYIYMYIYIYTCVYIYICVYTL